MIHLVFILDQINMNLEVSPNAFTFEESDIEKFMSESFFYYIWNLWIFLDRQLKGVEKKPANAY